jgi:hypothetical protein
MGLLDKFRKNGDTDIVQDQLWSNHFSFTRYLKKERDGD